MRLELEIGPEYPEERVFGGILALLAGAILVRRLA
jgi:hypothetical protein